MSSQIETFFLSKRFRRGVFPPIIFWLIPRDDKLYLCSSETQRIMTNLYFFRNCERAGRADDGWRSWLYCPGSRSNQANGKGKDEDWLKTFYNTACFLCADDAYHVQFLCGVARGLPIVSPRWLAESRKVGLFLDPWTFILRDEANEKKWGFKLETTLHQVTEVQVFLFNNQSWAHE